MKKIVKFKTNILLIGLVIGIIGLSTWLGSSATPILSEAKRIIRSYGTLGPLVLIGLYVLTVVFSPLAGGPLVITSLTMFGFYETFLYIYTSNLIGASINFFIARKFGRPLVTKLVGKESRERIDEIAEMVGIKTLIIFRFMGGGSFDFVSYAAGLTPMNFGIYFLITALGLIPGSIIFYYTLSRAIQLPLIYSLPVFIFIYALLVLIPAFMYRHQKRRSNRESNQELDVSER